MTKNQKTQKNNKNYHKQIAAHKTIKFQQICNLTNHHR